MEIKRNIFGTFIFILVLTSTTAFHCPTDCSCMEIPRNGYTFNHAKCTSLDGLRQLGKTSELHSLDLSGIGLTKITNQLDKLTNLTKIDLKDNNLSEVNNLFGKRVKTLNLSNNQITAGKLSKIPVHVKNLNLTHNAITYLPLEFKRLVHLKSFELAGNPLNCTCETLEVRNWLQERKVWTDKPILCVAPIEIKGRPWLQIRQSDVCDANGLDEPRTLPYSKADDENDLMQGDDPNVFLNEQSSEQNDNNDELNNEFLPAYALKDRRNADEQRDDETVDEGSGDEDDETTSDTSKPETLPVVYNENDQEYEGSGDEHDSEAPISKESSIEEEGETEATETEENATLVPLAGSEDDENKDIIDEIVPAARSFPLLESEPAMENSSDISPIVPLANANNELEILSTTEVPLASKSPNEVHEEQIVPKLAQAAEEVPQVPQVAQEEQEIPKESPKNEAEVVQPSDGENSASNSASIHLDDKPIAEANGTPTGTYILLIIILVLIVVLILYVATKRRRTLAKNRRNNNDVENAAQEMLNMDKSNLGKPITNGTEFIPLMPNKHPVDKENNLCNAQEPLLKKLTEEDETSQKSDEPTEEVKPQNGTIVENDKIENAKQSKPVESTPTQNGDTHECQPYQPISPKPSRYSPVSQ